MKTAKVNGEICIDFGGLWISPFKSNKEYGPNHRIQLWPIIHLLVVGYYAAKNMIEHLCRA